MDDKNTNEVKEKKEYVLDDEAISNIIEKTMINMKLKDYVECSGCGDLLLKRGKNYVKCLRCNLLYKNGKVYDLNEEEKKEDDDIL